MRMVVDDSKRCGGPDSPRQEENVLAVRRTPLRPVVVVELLYDLVVGIGLDHRGHGDDARSAVLPAGDDGVEDEALGGSASSLLEDLSVGPKVRILVEGIVDDPLPCLLSRLELLRFDQTELGLQLISEVATNRDLRHL